MVPAKTRVFRRVVPRSIRGCLLVIGLDFYAKTRHVGHGGMNSFWKVNAPRLEWILYDAHKRWLKEMKLCNGDTERAYALNGAWDRVEQLFSDHGLRLNT